MKTLFALSILLFNFIGSSQASESRVLWIPLQGTVELGLAPYIQRAIRYAEDQKFDFLVLEVDTFGGRVDAAVTIRDALLDSKVPTVAWVHKRAISAGALISLSCKKVFFSPGSTMGAATPIEMGNEGAKPVEEKFISYFKAEMGSTAEKNNRDRRIAESMVRASEDLKGYVKKNEVLTLTDKSAEALKFSDGTVDSQDQLLSALKISGAKVETLSINWAEKFVRLITDPTVSSLLMTVGVLCIMLEFQMPGLGPGFIAAAAFGLFFFGKFIVHLAGWEDLILFVLGVVLLAVELLLVPGKLVPGILGMIFMFAALFLSGISSKVPFDMTMPDIRSHATHVAGTFIVAMIGLIVSYWWISKHPIRSPLVLNTELDRAHGYSSTDDFQHLIGRRGKTTSTLRPSGKAQFEDAVIEVVTEGDFIEESTPVIVTAVEGSRVVVKRG